MMNTDRVLSQFEKLNSILRTSRDPHLHRKILGVVNSYPFGELSQIERWRLRQIRATIHERIARQPRRHWTT
jgi:hypothetical protein